MPVEVGRGVVRGQPLAVAVADLGEDVHPVPGLHAVVGLDVERALGLHHLEHLRSAAAMLKLRLAIYFGSIFFAGIYFTIFMLYCRVR